MIRELMSTDEAVRAGHSGWLGFDIFREYSDLVAYRNNRIISHSILSSYASTVAAEKRKTDDLASGINDDSDIDEEFKGDETDSVEEASEGIRSSDIANSSNTDSTKNAH